MALEEQSVTFPLKFGLDEGTEKDAQPGGMLVLENGIWEKEGGLLPRYGFQLDTDFTSNEDRGLVRAGGALGVIQRDAVLVYNPGSGIDPANVTASASGVNRTIATFFGGRTVLSIDAAYATGGDGRHYLAVTSVEGNNSTDTSRVTELWHRVFDYDTGVLKHESKVATAGGTPGPIYGAKVVTNGVIFLFVYTRDGDIYARSFTPQTLTFGTEFTAATNPVIVNGSAFDVVYDSTSGFYFIGYVLRTANEARVVKISTTAVIATSSAATTAAENNIAASGVQVAVAVSGNFVLLAFEAQSDDQIELQSFAVSNLALANRLDTTRAAPRNVAFAIASTTSFFLVYSDVSQNVKHEAFTLNASTGAFTAPGTVVTTANAFAVSKPFLIGSRWATSVVQAASEQHLYLAVHVIYLSDSTVVATVAHDESQPYRTSDTVIGRGGLSSVSTITTNVFAIPVAVSLESSGAYDVFDDDFKYRGRITELDFTAQPLTSANIQDTAYIAGSLPREFDGFVTREAAWTSAPHTISLAAVAGASLTAGTYQYASVLEHTDRNGNIRLSPPSVVASITLTTDRHVSITAYNDVLSGYDAATSSLPARTVIRIYRTEAGLATFYLLRSITAAAGVNTTFTDTTTDVLLSAAEQLDVSGLSELLSEPAPPLRAIWAHDNRLYGIRADTPRVLSYTKEIVQPTAPEWNSVLTKTVENSGGDLVAGGSLAGGCVLFQGDQILVMSGEGPPGSGPDADSDGFQKPEVVVHGIGARDAISVVQLPGGIFFRSKQGFYAMGNDASPSFIGDAVQDSEAAIGDTLAAAFLPGFHQVWVSGDASADILVYDTQFGRWSRFDGPWDTADRVVGIREIDGTVYVLTRGTSTSRIWKYTSSEDSDTNTSSVVLGPPDVTVDLPWFKGAGESGVFRVWRVIVAVKFATDLNSSSALRFRTYTASMHDPGKAPETQDMSRTYTFDDTTDAGLHFVRVRPVKQRCSAFRCQLTVQNGTEPMSLISVKYFYGVETEDGKTGRSA